MCNFYNVRTIPAEHQFRFIKNINYKVYILYCVYVYILYYTHGQYGIWLGKRSDKMAPLKIVELNVFCIHMNIYFRVSFVPGP